MVPMVRTYVGTYVLIMLCHNCTHVCTYVRTYDGGLVMLVMAAGRVSRLSPPQNISPSPRPASQTPLTRRQTPNHPHRSETSKHARTQLSTVSKSVRHRLTHRTEGVRIVSSDPTSRAPPHLGATTLSMLPPAQKVNGV